jgi:hypothetical protein
MALVSTRKAKENYRHNEQVPKQTQKMQFSVAGEK